MAGLFHQSQNGTYNTTRRNILAAAKFFKENPTGIIGTGMWNDSEWSASDFKGWFIRCLLLKCGGSEYNDKERDLIADCRKVNDYLKNRIRHTGCRNSLTTKRMQQKYPFINNQQIEY